MSTLRDFEQDDEVRYVFEQGCPNDDCDAPPARDLDVEAGELAEQYALTCAPGVTRCRDCRTKFDVETGEVIS